MLSQLWTWLWMETAPICRSCALAFMWPFWGQPVFSPRLQQKTSGALLLLYYSSLLIGELQGLTILSHRYDTIDPFLHGLLYLGPLCSTRGTTALVLATMRPVAWSRCAGARHLATWTMRTTAAAAGPLAAWWRRVYLPTHVSGVGLGVFVVPLSSSFWPL